MLEWLQLYFECLVEVIGEYGAIRTMSQIFLCITGSAENTTSSHLGGMLSGLTIQISELTVSRRKNTIQVSMRDGRLLSRIVIVLSM